MITKKQIKIGGVIFAVAAVALLGRSFGETVSDRARNVEKNGTSLMVTLDEVRFESVPVAPQRDRKKAAIVVVPAR